MTSFISANRWLESMLNWQPTNTSATTDQQKGDQDTLVARARDAWRNQLIAKAIIERLEINVIGSGLVLKPELGNADLEKQILQNWEKWIQDCEYERTINFYSLQSLVFSSQYLSGDVFINTVIDNNNNLRLQVIESDRVSNSMQSPDTKDHIQGVLIGQDGVPFAYTVQSTHPGDVFPEYTWNTFFKYGVESKKKRFLHIWKKVRPGQVRGIPLLTTVLESLRKMDRYMDAELTNAVVSALFAGFVKTEGGQNFPLTTASTESTDIPNDSLKDDQVVLKPGAIITLRPGEDITFANPNKPNPNYEAFVNSIIRQISACVSIPFDVLMMQFNDSYSASRAALMQFWKTVEKYRWEFIYNFCMPIYELWLDNEIINGRLNIPSTIVNIYKSSWVGPAKGSIDDTKEVIAARERINLGISDLQIEAEEIGGRDWLEVHKQRTLESDMRKAAGLEKEQQAPPQTPLTMEGKDDNNALSK